MASPIPHLGSIHPLRAVSGGRLTLLGGHLPVQDGLSVTVGDVRAHTVFASPRRVVIAVPAEAEGGQARVRVDKVPGHTLHATIGSVWATGLHQVDNPVFNRDGDLFVTYSGTRGQEAPVSVFRVTAAGSREPFATGIVNATSMAIGPDGDLYVSSRFEGTVYRVRPDGTHQPAGSDLGVACGLAFDSEGAMYVGDRSGTVFRVRDGAAAPFATLPPSVAAFHLAMSPDDELFVAAPTLGTYDHVYRVHRDGSVRALVTPFGRPQGLAFAPDGSLHVVEASAGASGIYRFADLDRPPELVVSGTGLVGLAFGPSGELVVATNDTAFRFEPRT